MKKGEIWYVDLGEGVGSEQFNLRPCMIVQNDIGNKYSPTTIVCPITTKTKNYNATHMEIEGLRVKSYIMFEQIRVVSKSRMIKYIYTMDVDSLREANKKLRIALDL